ncbi:hypothetical protein Hanom_Chr12g01178271 [Helianthus anomalus]
MNVSFERIVDIMKKHDELRIRASYHKLLEMSGDTLVWMQSRSNIFVDPKQITKWRPFCKTYRVNRKISC